MKIILLPLFTLIFTSCLAQNKELNSKVRQKQLKVQNQENSLDFNRMHEEITAKDEDRGPFTFGAFPYPIYDSISKNSFKGLGTSANFYGIKLNNKKIVYTSFSENKSKLNDYRVNEKNNVFFTILVLTDFIDDKEYSSMKTNIISRNFPDVIGQGYIKTSNNRIDFSAFITLENDQFAIVNMKLYNLKYGNIILISPQKDGSLRSIQINPKENLTTENLKGIIEELLKKQEIIGFFTNENTL